MVTKYIDFHCIMVNKTEVWFRINDGHIQLQFRYKMPVHYLQDNGIEKNIGHQNVYCKVI